MLRAKRRPLAAFALLIVGCLAMAWHLAQASPAPPGGGGPGGVKTVTLAGLTVTVTATATSSYFQLGTAVTVAGVTGTAVNPPPSTAPDGSAVSGPAWSWSVVPLLGSNFSTTLTGPDSGNPDVLALGATCNSPGQCQVSITGTATYTSASGLYVWQGAATTASPEFSGVQVTFPLPLYYVTPGSTTTVVPEVNPSSAASSVTFTTSDTDVATVVGSASSLTVTGVKPGSTQLLASISGVQLATTEVDVLKIKFFPREGPVLSEAFFEVEPPGVSFFSANTTITFNGTFYPEEFGPVPLSFTQQAPKVTFDPTNPNRLNIWVGAALPKSFLASTDPAILMGLSGKAKGTATLTDGETSCNVEVRYKATRAGFFGKFEKGVFKKLNHPDVWIVRSHWTLDHADPHIFMYGRMVRPTNEFDTQPPKKVKGHIRSFSAGGTPLSDGVAIDLVLMSSTAEGHLYQTAKPFVVVTDAEFEGPRRHVTAVAGAEGAFTVMRWQIP